ncbi:MAG: hypothetical protein IJS93_00085 [Clostridia bacterium]|nr:hypothetical protein [Clostridia bacterium]
MSKKKKIAIIVISIILVLIIAAATVMIYLFFGKGKTEKTEIDRSNLKGVETDESIVAWMTYDENSTQQELITLAVKAYENACKLDQNCDYRRYDVDCSVTTMGTVRQYITQIKNGEEFYRGEVQIPDDEQEPIFKIILKALKDQTFFNGQYANMTEDKMVQIKTLEGISRSESGEISADLDKGTVEYKDKPYFNPAQEQKYTQTDFIIRVDTIKNVSITHDDEKGFYTLVFDIDVENKEAIAKPYENLSANVENAKYTAVHETIELWDSGYFRYFRSEDQWTGHVVVDVAAEIDYQTVFIYEEDKCNIDECFGIEKLREEIAKQ